MAEIENQEDMELDLAVKCVCTKCGGECLAGEPDATIAWCLQCHQKVEIINPLLE